MTAVPLPLPGGRFVVPGNRWDLVPTDAVRPAPQITAVVPYYRERHELDLVLEALRGQDYPAERFEIVVADDGSPEPLVLSTSGDGPEITVVRQENRGFRAAAARNLGASVAQGELLCFLDQDTVPDRNYLRRLSALPSLIPDTLAVGRRRHADLTGWTPDQVRAWLDSSGPAPQELSAPQWLDDAYRRTGNLLNVDHTSYRFVISAVMCCTAALFKEIGGFDESFTSYGGEDWELAFRAYNAGAVLAHEPEAVAWHNGPDWAGRGDPASRRSEKAIETEQLDRLIPRPERDLTAGEPRPPRPASLLVRWTGTAYVDDLSLRSALLELLDCEINLTVHLDHDQADRFDLPRVLSTPISSDALARAQHLVSIDGAPCLPPAHLHQLRSQLESGAGRVTVHGEPGISALALRAVRRAARWESHLPGHDLVDELFGGVTTNVTAADDVVATLKTFTDHPHREVYVDR